VIEQLMGLQEAGALSWVAGEVGGMQTSAKTKTSRRRSKKKRKRTSYFLADHRPPTREALSELNRGNQSSERTYNV